MAPRVGNSPVVPVAPKPAEARRPEAPNPAPVAEQPKGWTPGARTERPRTTAPQQPPPPRYNGSADAAELYKAMKGGMFGTGTDEAAIFKVLENKTPDQIQAIRQAYNDHYKSNLDNDLKGEL